MIITILLSVLILLLCFNLYIDFNQKIYYEESICKEKMISKMSEIRMKLINMVYLGELDPNSKYFTFMFTSTSILIRLIYKHKLDKNSLEKFNVLKVLFENLKSCNADNKLHSCEVHSEIKSLTYEQKNLLGEISSTIMAIYTFNYFYKICYKLFKFFLFILKGQILKIKDIISIRLKKKIPSQIKENYEIIKTFDPSVNDILCAA